MGTFDKSDISVYIHIPFNICARRGEQTLTIPSTRETRNAYLEALEREMMAAGDLLEGRTVASLSIGGGIATTVSPDRLARLMLKFRRAYNVADGVEFSVTAAPQTLVSPCLSGLNMCSINRISMVALTPIDDLLETIDAPHRLDDIENGTYILGKFCCPNVDAVLLYGIPGQTLTTIRNTITAFAALKGLKHITLQRYELAGPSGVSPEECGAQYACAIETLAEKGLNQYTAECFAREGWESRFLMHELLGMERVGFGLGAKSYIDHLVSQNTTDFDGYLRDSGDFTKVITGVVEMSELDRIKRFVALRLQFVSGFSNKEYFDEFGSAPCGAIVPVIDALLNRGLVTDTGGVVRPTRKGLFHSGEVIATVMGG